MIYNCSRFVCLDKLLYTLVSGEQPFIVNRPFAIMLLTKDCLQVRQKTDGCGIPAYHRGATSFRDDGGRRPDTTECGGKAPTQLLRGHVVGW